MRTQLDCDGYPTVRLRIHGVNTFERVSRLVLAAFVGACPAGMQAAHLNGTRDDNRRANLAWTTPKENESHKLIHGTAQRGERNPNRSLTADQVREVRRLFDAGLLSRSAIGRQFGVSATHVFRIGMRENWRELPEVCAS